MPIRIPPKKNPAWPFDTGPLAESACAICGGKTRLVGIEINSNAPSDLRTYECLECGDSFAKR